MTFKIKKIYEGLYSLFEDELIEIGNYISFTENNLKSYSNKIHELHLRVCTEIENILKLIVTNHFIDNQEIKSLWDQEKSRFLKKSGTEIMKDYDKLFNSIKRKKDKDDLDKYLFGFPDFAFYFKLACEKINLNHKNVFFLLSLEAV